MKKLFTKLLCKLGFHSYLHSSVVRVGDVATCVDCSHEKVTWGFS